MPEYTVMWLQPQTALLPPACAACHKAGSGGWQEEGAQMSAPMKLIPAMPPSSMLCDVHTHLTALSLLDMAMFTCPVHMLASLTALCLVPSHASTPAQGKAQLQQARPSSSATHPAQPAKSFLDISACRRRARCRPLSVPGACSHLDGPAQVLPTRRRVAGPVRRHSARAQPRGPACAREGFHFQCAGQTGGAIPAEAMALHSTKWLHQ